MPPIFYYSRKQCCQQFGDPGKTHVLLSTADGARPAEVNTLCPRWDGCAGDTASIGVGRPFCPVVPAATLPTHDTFYHGHSLHSFPCNLIYFHRRRNLIMLNALSRAAIGALKAGKSNLTPKIVQNELPKAMVATTSTCEYDVPFSLIFLPG